MDRRGFLGAGMAGAAALTFSSVWSQSTPNFGAPVAPTVGFRRMKLGAMEVIALHDGALRRPLGEEFVTNAPLEQVKALLASQGLPTDYVDIPFTPFVIVAGGRRILMDTGFADNGPPSTGKLVANMAAAGLKPDDIDTIILSHYHGDHINGIRNKAGQLVFPKAKIMVPAPEHAFWMDDARMERGAPGHEGCLPERAPCAGHRAGRPAGAL
jgi:glyoxylase-like metal-dependent hydrolase (beta-lactamase superfamily II)